MGVGERWGSEIILQTNKYVISNFFTVRRPLGHLFWLRPCPANRLDVNSARFFFFLLWFLRTDVGAGGGAKRRGLRGLRSSPIVRLGQVSVNACKQITFVSRGGHGVLKTKQKRKRGTCTVSPRKETSKHQLFDHKIDETILWFD